MHGFVPFFVPASPEPEEGFSNSLSSAPDGSPPSKSPPQVPPCSSLPASEHARPRITLLRDKDRVTKIIVHCVCGHVIELDCKE